MEIIDYWKIGLLWSIVIPMSRTISKDANLRVPVLDDYLFVVSTNSITNQIRKYFWKSGQGVFLNKKTCT
jgi:hypothetical protein